VPPQSTSVSVPFFTLSAQPATRHRPELQVPLMQSRSTSHAWSDSHAAHESPPQSTPVSPPFLTPSSHAL
jgi:hypothetical protein